MKLSKAILGLIGFGSTLSVQKCIISEHIGFAETEFQAHLNLLGVRGFGGDAANPSNGFSLRSLYLKTDGTSMFQINNFCLTAMLPHKSDKTTMNYDWDGADTEGGSNPNV